MIALPKTPVIARMTVTEFLTWPADPSGRTWQLIDGEPVAMAPASKPERGDKLGAVDEVRLESVGGSFPLADFYSTTLVQRDGPG